jgi:hypothetical protein
MKSCFWLPGLLLLALGCAPAGEESVPPEAARSRLNASLAQPDAHARVAELLAFFEQVEYDDIYAVEELYTQTGAYLDPLAVVLFAQWWADADPERAFYWFAREQVSHAGLGASTAMRTWARRDPRAALNAAESAVAGPTRQANVDAALLGWAESEGEKIPETLLDYIQALPRGIARQKAANVIVTRMVRVEGAEATLRFAERYPETDPRYKLTLHRKVVTAVARHDLERAAAWALEQSQGEFGDGLMRRVGALWARRDVEAALDWVVSAPDSAQRDEALREVYRTWLVQDREAALAWIRAQARLESVDADAALHLFILALSVEDPAEAAKWLPRLQNEALRNTATFQVGSRWIASDPETAGAWLAQASVPGAVRERILAEAAGSGS